MNAGDREHACAYAGRLVWSDWTRSGPLAERLARRIPLCTVCGGERPARRPRPARLRERRAAVPEALPPADAHARSVAAVLVRRGREHPESLPAGGVFSELRRRGIPASLAETWIEAFLRAGWLTAIWKLGAVPRLSTLSLLRPDALRELAWPGLEARRGDALREARARVAGLSHPKAAEIAAVLAEARAESFPPPLVQALAALAVHAESGDVLAARVFSARHLGGSKILESLRGRLERLAGPLAAIGIREGAGVTLVGGAGALRFTDRELDLGGFPPFLGLARETLADLRGIAFPAGGLFVAENLTVFEACCRGEVRAARDALIAWSAGYPGRAVRRLVELAGAAGAPLRIWADLDLDGVRIARLLASWSPEGSDFFRMSPADLAAAPGRRRLNARSLAAIRRDLAERPDAPLAGTLRALLDSGSWAEQESLLGIG